MSHIETFETEEAAALAGLDGDLAAVAKTSAERQAAIAAAQLADLAGSADGAAQRESAHTTAIAADAALKTGRQGRPPISDERRAYRQLVEDHDESADRFRLALDSYLSVINQLKAAGPELDSLQGQADEQVALCKQVVQHLDAAAAALGQAADLAENGRAVMARLGDLIAFNESPYVDMTAGPREIMDLAKRYRLRLDAELARLGRDPAEALEEQRQSRAAGDYKTALAAAADSFRKTPDGKRLWTEYRLHQNSLDASLAAEPHMDHGGFRDQVQRLLSRFYEQAAGLAGIQFDPAAVPQI